MAQPRSIYGLTDQASYGLQKTWAPSRRNQAGKLSEPQAVLGSFFVTLLWNVSVLKATIENKTTFVTTH